MKILKEEDNNKNASRSKKSRFSEKIHNIEEFKKERKRSQESLNDDLSCFQNYEVLN